MTPVNDALRAIQLQVMWNRLIAVVEEQAQTLIRTAFSTSVREAGDLAAAVFDRQGRMLAQAVTGLAREHGLGCRTDGEFVLIWRGEPWLELGLEGDRVVILPG